MPKQQVQSRSQKEIDAEFEALAAESIKNDERLLKKLAK